MKLNNAVILHEQLYFDRLKLFEEMFQAQGGDLRHVIRLIIDAGATNPEDPYAAVASLAVSH
jgi:hypothetical protein